MTTLNRDAFSELIAGDLEWLRGQPRTLERDHIELLLQQADRDYDGQGRFYPLLPDRLTAENGAKAALSGEFFEEFEMHCGCDDDGEDETELVSVAVTWTTIKQIWKEAVAFFNQQAASRRESLVLRDRCLMCKQTIQDDK